MNLLGAAVGISFVSIFYWLATIALTGSLLYIFSKGQRDSLIAAIVASLFSAGLYLPIAGVYYVFWLLTTDNFDAVQKAVGFIAFVAPVLPAALDSYCSVRVINYLQNMLYAVWFLCLISFCILIYL